MGTGVNLLVFGLGYTAGRFALRHADAFDRITGTVRSPERAGLPGDVEVLRFDSAGSDPAVEQRLADSDALLVSVQPGEKADPVLGRFGEAIAAAPRLRSIVYLSTIGVYGDHRGAWIDESATTAADNPRQRARIFAERHWLALGEQSGKRVLILRLAGIYGPGRNALQDLQSGEARRIDKPGQVFNRIHVDDIGTAIAAGLRHEGDRSIFNVTDDEPAPAPEVVAYAAQLAGLPPPPIVPFAEADMSPMARSFYSANRRVRNDRLKAELGVALAYPTYRAGLDALWADGEGRAVPPA
jgi:nucleoside-diphosphate-sugar epimerase